MVVCRISLLDGTTFEPNGIDKNSTGQGVFDKVTQHLDLIETDYFGLTYRDKTNKKFWVDNTKKISKQLKGSSWVFEFQVKFYPPDPQALKEDLTRYQVCLQVRVDIFNGRLPCSFVTYALLGSYTVQAELGDYDPLEYGGRIDYLKDFDFAPVQQAELLEKITELHKHHKGQTPEEAESHFLENAKKLAMYGVDLHDVKDVENKPLVLGIHASGILVYKDRLRINRFVWPKILKLSYKRNIFYVQIRPGPADPHEKTVGFKLDNHKMAKRLWKTCVEHHAFFRLKDVEGMNEGTLFPRFNTKFRYSGRTQAQAKKAAEAQHRPEPHIARTAERRSLNKDKSKDDMELNRNDIDPSRIEDGKQRRAPVNKEEEDRRKAEFFQLLRETPSISRHSRWNDVRPRIDSDPRYEAVGSDPKGQEWFNEYVRDLGLKEDFHKLLDDTPDINRHSKWGDVKHKIEADPRYRAIDSALKKEQWFNDYLKDLGTKEEFQQLLKETPDIDRYSHLNDVKPAIEHDPRYQAVGSDAKREEWFDDYVKNLGLKEDFVQLLKDTPDIHRNSNWEDAKHKLDSDPRYVAVNSSPKREEWFKEYIKGLDSKDEKRRKKEEERKRKEEEKEKKRLEKEKKKKKGDAEDRTDKMGDPNATHTMNGYPDAAELEQGAVKAGKEGTADGHFETDIDTVLAAKKDEGKDGKHGKKGEKGDSFRGGLFGKFGRKSPKGSKKDKEYDPSKDEFPPPPSPLDEEKKKKAGMTWALPGMEELKERQESGSQLKADFFQLLKETPEVDSRSRLSDVKKKIESDPRYKAVDGDPRREDWFREYTRHLGDLKADYFKLLKDTPGIDRHSKWNDVKHKIESDPRYIAVDSNARREDWFKEFIRNQIRHDFFQLLRDTPDITRHSKWNDVKRKIDHDPRFKAVDSSARREDWFKDYVRDLGLKEDYRQLLKDTPDVNRDSRWRDIRPKIEHDPRYIAVDSNARREDWFRDYVRDLRLDDGMYPGGDKSIDRKMQFMPIVPPTVETKSKGDASRMPFFEPAGESDDSFGKKGPPPIAKKPKAPGGYDSEEDRFLRHSGEPPTVQTESFKYTPNLDEIPITTSNIPIVETKTHTVTYEKDGVPFETEDSILISAHSVTTKSQTIDTTTYKTERDGVIETRVERKITVTSDENDDIDHDRLLREAIEAVTNMNPDVSVERIECIKQIEGEK